MTKRSLLLSIAAGLLASVAFATPSHAGTTTVTTIISFTALDAPVGSVNDVTVTYTPNVDPISSLMVTSNAGLTGVGISETSANTVTVTFNNAASATGLIWTFTTATPPTGLTFDNFSFSGSSTDVSSNVRVVATTAGVPEPASMALLGIGMTGLLAFRRLFKRPSVA